MIKLHEMFRDDVRNVFANLRADLMVLESSLAYHKAYIVCENLTADAHDAWIKDLLDYDDWAILQHITDYLLRKRLQAEGETYNAR